MKDQKVQEENKKQENKASPKNIFFSIISFFNIITIFFIIIIFIVFMLSPYSFQGNNINEYANDYCNNIKNENYDFLCTNKYYKYNIKKSKFIWIMTDGTAADQTILLRNYENYKITTSFLVEEDDITYKQSNELHQALITGKHNKNFKGKYINHDNIIQQLINAGYKINYKGWDKPIPSIVGDIKDGIKENKIFNKKFIDNNHEITAFSSFCNITNPFPFLKLSHDRHQSPIPNKEVDKDLLNKIEEIINNYESHLYDKETKLQLYEDLDNLFEEYPIDLFTINIDDCLKKSFNWNENENISIIFYTTEVDHFNHLFGKAHIYNVLQMYITEKMIERIMGWIDIHDDYALIVTSDHGGQEFYGEDSLKNHGEDNPGNEAIFFIYSKVLKDQYDELKMKERYIYMNDESTIIPQILLNINIPINSKGFPQQIIDDDINFFISLKMKEIQLIKLIERYIEKYKNYENNLKDLLNELKSNYSLTNSIKNEYIAENLTIYPNKLKEFKKVLKAYKSSLINKQEEIIKIIDENNRAFENIIFFVAIFVFILIKFCFEIYFLFFKILDTDKVDLNTNSNKVWLFINIFAFIIFFIFLFYINIINIDLRTGISNYCFSYGCLISIFYFYCIFNKLELAWYNNKTKIILFIGSIICFTLLIQSLNYSDCFYYVKKNFTYFSKIKIIIINLFSFYLFLFFYIFREIFKFKEKKYFIVFCEKKVNVENLYYFYFLLVLSFFIEDFTKEDYYGQNITNIIFVWINFLLLLIFFILSNFYVYEEKIILNEGNELNNENNYIQNVLANDQYMNLLKEIDNKDNQILDKRQVQGLPLIKLFLVFLFSWISDEGQKLLGLIILVPFLEILDYLSNDLLLKINEIKNKKQNNELNDINEDEPLKINSNIDIQKNENKSKKQNNNYIIYFFIYIILQDLFLVSNMSVFALIKYSFGLQNDTYMKSKFVYSLKFVKNFLKVFAKYKYIFIILGFFLEKGIYDKNNNQQFSMGFSVRKVMLGLRIDIELIYLFYQMLINVNDKIFINLFIYCFLNCSLLLLDYIGYEIAK